MSFHELPQRHSYLSDALSPHSFTVSAERMRRVLRAAGGTEAAASAVECMLETGVEHLLHVGSTSAKSAHHRADEELGHLARLHKACKHRYRYI